MWYKRSDAHNQPQKIPFSSRPRWLPFCRGNQCGREEKGLAGVVFLQRLVMRDKNVHMPWTHRDTMNAEQPSENEPRSGWGGEKKIACHNRRCPHHRLSRVRRRESNDPSPRSRELQLLCRGLMSEFRSVGELYQSLVVGTQALDAVLTTQQVKESLARAKRTGSGRKGSTWSSGWCATRQSRVGRRRNERSGGTSRNTRRR